MSILYFLGTGNIVQIFKIFPHVYTNCSLGVTLFSSRPHRETDLLCLLHSKVYVQTPPFFGFSPSFL